MRLTVDSCRSDHVAAIRREITTLDVVVLHEIAGTWSDCTEYIGATAAAPVNDSHVNAPSSNAQALLRSTIDAASAVPALARFDASAPTFICVDTTSGQPPFRLIGTATVNA
jgi:hypothetical protein